MRRNLEVEDLTQEEIGEAETELLMCDSEDIFQSWLQGSLSDAEVLDKLKYAKIQAKEYATTYLLDRKRRGA